MCFLSIMGESKKFVCKVYDLLALAVMGCPES